MNEQDLILAMSSWISVAAWILFWFVPHRMSRRDSFRQELFEIRDRLFDYCQDNGISHSHPAYGMIRMSANGLIHYADRISLWTSILGSATRLRPTPGAYEKQLEKALAQLSNKDREVFDRAHADIHFSIAKYLVTTSVVLIAFTVLVAIFLTIKHASVRALRSMAAEFVPYTGEVENEAYCSAEAYSHAK